MDERLNRIESMVEMAADNIPTITITTMMPGIMGRTSSEGVARSASVSPGTNNLAENPQKMETRV